MIPPSSRQAAGVLIALILAAATTHTLAASQAASTSTPEDLAPLVQLIDAWTGEPELLDEAQKAFQVLLQAHPDSAPAHREYARYHIMRWASSKDPQRSLEAAEMALDRALELDPQFAEAFVLRGHLYRLQGRTDDAKTALLRAEQLGTNDPWLDLNWADLLRAEDKWDEAITRCRRALARKHINAKARYSGEHCLIKSHSELGDWKAVEKVHGDRIKREPQSAAAYRDYAAFLLCRRDDTKRAAQVAATGAQLAEPGDTPALLATALYADWAKQVRDGHSEAADRAWDRASTMPVADPAAMAEVVCGRKTAQALRHALRDTNRGVLIAPVVAVMMAAEAKPEAAPGIFALEVNGTGQSRGEVYLNSETEYRDPLNLTVRISPSAAAAFRQLHGDHPDVALKGKRITVVGAVIQRRIDFRVDGAPSGQFYYQNHIDVNDPNQIAIFDPTVPPPPERRASIEL